MKRILIALAVLLTIQVADAQVTKTPAAALKAVESAKAASENPKKEAKVATWLKLASAYMDAYNAPTGSFFTNAPRIQLQQMPGYKPAASVEQVVIEGVTYKKESYEDKVLYFDPSDMLTMIVVTKPVCEDPLAGALAAYAKAAEVDVKATKAKDIKAGIELIGAKYFDEGMVQYTLGDNEAAAGLIAKAADAVLTAPVSKVDTIYTYYAGYIYNQAGKYELAKKYFDKCLEAEYYAEGGNLFPALADVYMKLGDEEAGVATLKKGFELFPENANVLVGLINYYLPKEGGEAELLALIEKAKAAMPDNPSIFRVEGDIYKRLKDYEKAEAAYYKSMEVDPNAPDAYIALGGYFIDRGNEYFNEGQETYEQAAYEALMAKYDEMCIASLDPLVKAYQLIQDENFKRDIANTIKSVCFVLRNKDPKYQAMFEEYNGYLNN